MLWLLYAVLAAVFRGFASLVHRTLMKKESHYAYGFAFNIFSAIPFLPLFLASMTFPAALFPYLVLASSVALWTIITLTGLIAYKLTDVSLRAPIGEVRQFFALFLSVLLLAEILTSNKIIGTLLIFLGIVLLTYERKGRFRRFSEKGVQFTILTAFLVALVAIVDKAGMNYFSQGTWGFLVYLIPGLILMPLMRKRIPELRRLFKRWPLVLAAVALAPAYYYAELSAFKLADASLVFPVVRLSTMVAVIGGIILLREREEIPRKLISTAIVILGVLVLSGFVRL